MNEDQVRRIVRRVLYRTLGLPYDARPAPVRRLVTEAELKDLPVGAHLTVPPGALITPLARQIVLERKIKLEKAGTDSLSLPDSRRANPGPTDKKMVAVGADHGGFALKETLKVYLAELGYGVVDCGTDSTASVDYPDLALAVARLVAQGRVHWGIVVDGAGIGSCMAANKVPGVRAAMCYDQATAVNSREHNHANVLTLGAGLIGSSLARQIVKTWLETPVGGGRHARRVDKIMDIERRFSKDSAGG